MKSKYYEGTVLSFGLIVFFLGCLSPPGLMDDVDAVQAQIARTMLESGDWVTPKLNEIAYMEKPPMKYWLIAFFFGILGVQDWVARLPIALGAVALAWGVFRFGKWAISERAGFHAGLAVSTCIGLFLFTRVLISDVLVTLSITIALWSFLRIIEMDEPKPNKWSVIGAICISMGVLFKGLISIVFPLGIAGLYLIVTGQIFQKRVWQRVNLPLFIFVILAITLPWHVLATLRNPPYFDFSMVSQPGEYHGFFWFYFFNEHVLRFLGRRHPKDYSTVPLLSFWLLNLVWLFPWSTFLFNLKRLNFSINPQSRLEKTSILAICWIVVVMGFFSFSTRHEYYAMPIYPALALLIGFVLDKKEELPRFGLWIITSICLAAIPVILFILYLIRNVQISGDISNALTKSDDVYEVYTRALGHFGDLTLSSFAYLRFPLTMALISALLGITILYFSKKMHDFTCILIAVMMLIFFQAAQQALIVFEPYLGSRPLAEALQKSPPGKLIVDNQYYIFSSVFFYCNPKEALLLNGRVNNLEYGSYAPNAPDVFIDDTEFREIWIKSERYYLLIEKTSLNRFQKLLGVETFYKVHEAGGKLLLTNQELIINENKAKPQKR